MKRWLSLKVQNARPSKTRPAQGRVFISVPKRVVRLAVERNRIRRVLREAIRLGGYFASDKVVWLRVLEKPALTSLRQADEALKELHV